ncbi:MAG: TIGR03620 family F420-dependent LLM class oxidoreductase [Acidimicrobiales bacterium]
MTDHRAGPPRIGVWYPTEGMAHAEAAAFAARLEALGFDGLWIGETFGRDPFAHIANIAHATTRLRFATGIANVYHRHPGAMAQAANTLGEQLPERFVLGLGVSSPQIVERHRGLDHTRPLSFLRDYLDRMDAAMYFSVPPPFPVPRLLAAIGPRMLELAAARSAGAFTYNMNPDHTRFAKGVVGADAELVVEQKVMLCTDAGKARAAAASVLDFYRKAPGYRAGWRRLGFTDQQIDTGDPAFLDSIVAWGDEHAIRDRLAAHVDAGATQLVVQPVDPDLGGGGLPWSVLELLAPTVAG